MFNAEDAENRRESQRGFINLRSSATLRVLCVKSIASAIRTRVPVARLRTVCILAAVKRILRRASLAGLGIKSIAERKETVQAVAEEMTSGGAYGEAQSEAAPALADPAAGPTLIANPKSATRSGMEIDAPLCYSCGSKMQPAGSCYVCSSCGSTSGCS